MFCNLSSAFFSSSYGIFKANNFVFLQRPVKAKICKPLFVNLLCKIQHFSELFPSICQSSFDVIFLNFFPGVFPSTTRLPFLGAFVLFAFFVVVFAYRTFHNNFIYCQKSLKHLFRWPWQPHQSAMTASRRRKSFSPFVLYTFSVEF